jgi:peptide/nickel transport system substrate-binding protein
LEWALPADEIGRLYKRDVEGARKLLADAGLSAGFDFELIVADITPAYVPAAELIQQQWKEVNIRATIRKVDGAAYSGQVRGRGEFQAYLGSGAQFSSADSALLSKYHSKGASNVYGIKDEKLDQMIEQQTQLGRKPDERKKLLLDIQRYILDQAYVHFFHTFESPALFQPYVRDYYPGFGALNLEADHWTLLWLDK